jgi:hypothetical protein
MKNFTVIQPSEETHCVTLSKRVLSLLHQPLEPRVNQLSALYAFNGNVIKATLNGYPQLSTDVPSDFHEPEISYEFLISH